MYSKKIIILLLIFCVWQQINAQIKINEYSVSNTSNFTGSTFVAKRKKLTII